ncbi:hypothetical protein KXV66_001912 [Aspergillus fumigatus]|nr:hypothetical protein KXX43_000425 [Aspergillus fumigatus]KAH2755800.1 hypothetical protein KXV66_001912 [Aspergillus fumigatus]
MACFLSNGFSDSKPEEAPAGLARAYANGNEILGIITPPSSVTDWYAMVQLFGHPSAPWPWDRARALWTAFGIFMPFVFDLSLAKAKENDRAHWDVLEAIIGYLHICGGNVPTPQHWWRFSGLAWASSPLGARDETATVPVTTASGINQCYARSASITRPMGILRSGPDGRYGPSKSNEEVKEKAKKDGADDDEEEEQTKDKEVEDEFTEKFKMALRITASRSSKKPIATMS